MRTISMLTIAIIAIASTATAYYFLRDSSAKRAEEAKPSIGSTATLDEQDPPLRDGRRDEPAHLEQPRLTRLQDQVAALEARLRTMEMAIHEPPPRQAVSGPDGAASHHGAENAKAYKRLTRVQDQVAALLQEQVALEARLRTMEMAVREPPPRQARSESDGPTSHHGAEEATAHEWSDADFARWMDAALDAGDVDRAASESVMEQAATSVATVPGSNLADLQCGARFCRATLIPETSEPFDIAQLIGASPFIGVASTVHGPDGSVSVYLVPPGESFDELRREAQATAR
jgi:hypothetical protein